MSTVQPEDRLKINKDIGFDPDHSPSEGRWFHDEGTFQIVSTAKGVLVDGFVDNPYVDNNEVAANLRIMNEARNLYDNLVRLSQLGSSLLEVFREQNPGRGYAFQQALIEAAAVLKRACGAEKSKLPMGMQLEEIKSAVRAGRTVCWASDAYEVRLSHDEWLIVCNLNQSTIGLTHMDGVTMNGDPQQFFIKGYTGQ